MQRLLEIFRFYQVGAVNAAFGFGMYALLVWFGLGIYLAQVLAHILGVAFNYFSYSRHVFRDARPAKLRFVASYAVNYLVSVAVLALVSIFVHSPYLAGLATIVIASVANYAMLRYLVFVRKAQA
jgi:putative flippase GtrA